ncbi:hypothetical protein [Nonomuraea sp. NPDC048916]|uniref:hypothetical protein n=1 Tax=Nonomuraea sp. NPDC048916 TaxID=3154232 RepID=UPI0033DAC06C
MNRCLVALATVLALTACARPSADVAQIAGAPATDAAAALDREFARRSTVRVDVELTVRSSDTPEGATFHQSGVLRLSPSGVNEADLVLESPLDVGGSWVLHTIQAGGHVYSDSSLNDDQPPWSRVPRMATSAACNVPSYIGCLVDVLQPGVAKALLAASVSAAPADPSAGAGTVRHSGVITSERLNQAAGKDLLALPLTVVPAALRDDRENPWSLWIGSDGLPHRVQASGPLVSVEPEPVDGLSMAVDIRFYEWGGSQTITAPTAYTVIK